MLLSNKYSGVSDFPTAARIFEVYDQLKQNETSFFLDLLTVLEF